MTEDHSNSQQQPRPEDATDPSTPLPPHAHPGAPSWEVPPPPSAGTPGAGAPGTAAHGAPGYGTPGNGQLGYGQPGSPNAAPGYGAPGNGQPGYAQPGYAQPGSPNAAPGYGAPGNAQPGYGQPHYGQPGGPQQVNAAPSFRSWQPGIIPLRPLNFGDFLTVPFKAMRFNRAVVLGAPLLFTLASTVLVLVTMWVVFTDPQLGLLNTVPSLDGITATTVVMVIVSLLAVLLADVFSSSVIAPGVARAVLGERISISLAWRQVRRRLGSLLLLYLASATILTLLIVIAVAPVLLTIGSNGPNIGMVFLTLLLVFVLMIPAGIVVSLFQGVARAAIVLEGVPIGTALRRVRHLMRGRFWWSILIFFVSSILINVVSQVLQYMGQFGSIAVAAVAPDNMTVFLVTFMIVYGLSYAVALVLTYSYLGSVFSLMYIDMRMRREGFDLDLARAAEERAGR